MLTPKTLTQKLKQIARSLLGMLVTFRMSGVMMAVIVVVFGVGLIVVVTVVVVVVVVVVMVIVVV